MHYALIATGYTVHLYYYQRSLIDSREALTKCRLLYCARQNGFRCTTLVMA